MSHEEMDIVEVFQGGKYRLGVVLKVFQDEDLNEKLCVSVMGYTSQLNENVPSVVIDPDTRMGARNARAMGITKTTYFQKRYVMNHLAEDVRRTGLRCHHVVFGKLQHLLLGPKYH